MKANCTKRIIAEQMKRRMQSNIMYSSLKHKSWMYSWKMLMRSKELLNIFPGEEKNVMRSKEAAEHERNGR
ncbi:hypothetical protein Pyn_07522 [Prunus yedoensis var. nudiflora]|uniref:Uncharacterized protein n=1 Tax=Prunus yedoensis var. nudiflora TaxID=2094558 RepID=A0A314UA98_PRUYE|nr:hypothetical protein Pyn_07522 [Prunus yedoensis var. nudiflora]